MTDETKADPAALRAYSADMRARVDTTRASLADYRLAIAAFNAAPKEEVHHEIPDRSAQIGADLDWLAFVDAQPEAFAEALEAVDRTAFPSGLFGDRLYESAVQTRYLSLLEAVDPALAATMHRQIAVARAEVVADAVRVLLADDEASLAAWQAVAARIEAHADDETFTAALFTALGGYDTARVPMALEQAWQASDAYGDGWNDVDSAPAWEVLGVFSSALATASHTLGSAEGLRGDFVDDLLAAPDQWREGASLPPTLGEVGLLLSSRGFSDEFLLPVAAFAEAHLSQPRPPGFAGTGSPWGPFADPAVMMLAAVGDSPVAAGSQPRVLAQLTALGELTGDDLDLAYLEAARRDGQDPAFRLALLDELEATRMVTAEEGRDLGQWLVAASKALVAVSDAGRGTLEDLRAQRSEMGRQLRRARSDKPWAKANPETVSAAGRSLRRTPGWLSTVAGSTAFRIGGRGLLPLGVGLDVLHHRQQGRDWVETGVRTGAGTGGALAVGGVAAKGMSPLLAGGPWGWAGYGLGVGAAGVAGGLGADWVVSGFFEEDPDANLWVDGFGREGLPEPGPPEQHAR